LHDHEHDSGFRLHCCKSGATALSPVNLHQQKVNGKEPNPISHTLICTVCFHRYPLQPLVWSVLSVKTSLLMQEVQ